MGAGRGGLSLSTAQHPALSGQAHVVMVDRGRFRTKADSAFRRMQSEEPRGVKSWDRLYCDITDFWMPGASFAPVVSTDQSGTARDISLPASAAAAAKPGNSAEAETKSSTMPLGMVITAKHLCGGGTDVALRSLQHAQDGERSVPGAQSAAPQPPGTASNTPISSTATGSPVALPPLVGLVMATCCHHGCAWATYVGTEWWEGVAGLSPLHFAVAAWASSWQAGSWSSVLHSIAGKSHKTSQVHSWLQHVPVPSAETLKAAVVAVASGAGGTGQMQAASGIVCASAAECDVEPAAQSAQPSVVPSPDSAEHQLTPNQSQAALGQLANTLCWDDVQRLHLGRVCKRLIDEGRAHFVAHELRCWQPQLLQAAPAESTSAGLTMSAPAPASTTAAQMCYCSGHLTLENIALVAHSSSEGTCSD